MNPDADFANVQPAFLESGKQPWQCLAEFCSLRDRSGENHKYVLPDLAVQGRELARVDRRFAQCRKDQPSRKIGAFAASDQCGGRRFGEGLGEGFAGVHLKDKKRALAQSQRIIRCRARQSAGG